MGVGIKVSIITVGLYSNVPGVVVYSSVMTTQLVGKGVWVGVSVGVGVLV